MKGNALIRNAFNVEPEKLSLEKWAQLFNEALWLRNDALKNQAELFAQLLGGKKR